MGKSKKKNQDKKLPHVKNGGTSIETKRWASKQGRSHISQMKTDHKGKTTLTFNMKQRNDFLSSFKKRKDIRRQVAKEEIDQDAKEARKEF